MSNSEQSGQDPLVALAREAIEAYVREGKVIQPSVPSAGKSLQAGTFVSLHRPDGALRGCIGTIEPQTGSVEEEVIANAVSAATADPRFYPLKEDELADIDISVDVLGPAEEVVDRDELDPKRYGIIIRSLDGRRALLLPDLEGVQTVEQQVNITCRKGSIDPDKDEYRIYRFEVERHH